MKSLINSRTAPYIRFKDYNVLLYSFFQNSLVKKVFITICKLLLHLFQYATLFLILLFYRIFLQISFLNFPDCCFLQKVQKMKSLKPRQFYLPFLAGARYLCFLFDLCRQCFFQRRKTAFPAKCPFAFYKISDCLQRFLLSNS